jgi:hypothetical protein
METLMAPRKAKSAPTPADPKPTTTARRRGPRRPTRQQQEHAPHAKARQKIQRRAAQRHVEHLEAKAQQQVEAQAQMAQMPIVHEHAAGIDVGDASHWVCVEQTPDGSDTVREFPAHTPGLRQLVAWLRQCGVTTVALEASGVYDTSCSSPCSRKVFRS